MKLSELVARVHEIKDIAGPSDPEVRIGVGGNARPIAAVGFALHESQEGSRVLDDMIVVIEYDPS